MKKITVIAIILCGLTAACTVRSERTVVQPTPQPATVVTTDGPPPGTVVTTDGPPPGTVVYR